MDTIEKRFPSLKYGQIFRQMRITNEQIVPIELIDTRV